MEKENMRNTARTHRKNFRSAVRHWLCLCLLLGATGCSSSDSEGLPPGEAESMAPFIEVELSTRALNANDDLVTYPEETTLVGTQHATQVRLYVFKGIGESAEYCGMTEDIGWKEHFTANGGELPDHTASMNYRLKNQLVPNTPYEFLAVGMNDEGAAAFEVPLTALAEANPETGTTATSGTPLREAIGQLRTLATAGKQEQASTPSIKDIRRSEIYVGTATYQPANHGATRITLYRRVAGVAAWFTNVPKTVTVPITEGVADRTVNRLQLVLYRQQNEKLPLLRRQQKPKFQDYIESSSQAAEAIVLMEIKVSQDLTSTTQLHGGSFVLPVPAPADQGTYTMRLELLNAASQVLSVRRIKLPKDDDLNHGDTGGGTGIIDTESAFRFPLIANHYYGIGSPNKPIDLKGGGADLVITVDPTWEDEPDLELGDKEQKTQK